MEMKTNAVSERHETIPDGIPSERRESVGRAREDPPPYLEVKISH
jgi:hypothetical protein